MSARTVSSQKLLSIFGQLSKISALVSLQDVLAAVLEITPKMVGAVDCSIFLLPEFVPYFDGTLHRADKAIPATEVNKNFIVLAATTQSTLQDLIGRAFYQDDEGITGWVFGHGTFLNLKDVADQEELNLHSKSLKWVNAYSESWNTQKTGRKRALLAIPLRNDSQTFGVIEYPAPAENAPFSAVSEKIALLVAQIMSSAIQNIQRLREQNNTILSLMEISKNKDMRAVLKEVTHSLRDMVHCSSAAVYVTGDNHSIRLEVENGSDAKDKRGFIRGQDAIGWVFNTGKPLFIESIRAFFDPTVLSDELLIKISNGPLINEDDRNIQLEADFYETGHGEISIIAIPVIVHNEVLAVLSVQASYGYAYSKRSYGFTQQEFDLCTSFARTISLAFETQREQELSRLLIQLGYLKKYEDIFDQVVATIPELVLSSNCSIYRFKRTVTGNFLELTQTSRSALVGNGSKLRYQLGEGKTGLCGLLKATMVINHFGSGDASEEAIQSETVRISAQHKKDLISRLVDRQGIQVGIIQLRGGKILPHYHQEKYRLASKRIIETGNGLDSAKKEFYLSRSIPSPYSFVAAPIARDDNLFGVMTLTRVIPKTPFAHQDITLIESIAGRLANVLGEIHIEQQREELLMSLGHELNTPITGILAESENLRNELQDRPDLAAMAKNNLEQVLRLHLQTETIMGVLSETDQRKNFEFVNIYEPLKVACELFASEAAFKGCDILEPKAIGDSVFPFVEMSRFDIEFALKNIIHNAVKYSYRPTKGQEKHRYVNIWGIWAGSERQLYKINVQNYGVGITQEEIEKRSIFERFRRGENANDRRRTGAGFGLAYARRIIEDLHQGKIAVTSEPTGNGDAHLTTFTITLPVLQLK